MDFVVSWIMSYTIFFFEGIFWRIKLQAALPMHVAILGKGWNMVP